MAKNGRKSKLVAAGPLVLDSSCWLEVFDGGTRAQLFEAAASEPEMLLAPWGQVLHYNK